VAFIADLDDTVQRIHETPERWLQFPSAARRCLLRSFPFAVVDAIEPDAIHVIAVAHGRRRPGYWKRRDT
jgi:toxin ParE1/3/4